VTFPNTSFFTSGHYKLPTPAKVRRARGNKDATVPVSFPSMNLIVKYGRKVSITEGQCLWAIRQLIPKLPVPEVYGWYTDQGETFIYMQRIDAPTLEKEWPTLDFEDKYKICVQLRAIINDMRRFIRQDPAFPFVGECTSSTKALSKFDEFDSGSINHEPVKDVLFEGAKGAVPFQSVRLFNDWFAGDNVDPWRSDLWDSAPIVFTSANLHRSNILMRWDEKGDPRVAAIVDWHQAGWYPATWEYFF
jgi:hypothetical protein